MLVCLWIDWVVEWLALIVLFVDMVSGNLFHHRKHSWPPEEYISRATLQLVSAFLIKQLPGSALESFSVLFFFVCWEFFTLHLSFIYLFIYFWRITIFILQYEYLCFAGEGNIWFFQILVLSILILDFRS